MSSKSPVKFRESVTLKFPPLWQFQTNFYRQSCTAVAESWLDCLHCMSGLSQDCIFLRVTEPTLKLNSPSVSGRGKLEWGEREKREGGQRAETERVKPYLFQMANCRGYLHMCKTDRPGLVLRLIGLRVAEPEFSLSWDIFTVAVS